MSFWKICCRSDGEAQVASCETTRIASSSHQSSREIHAVRLAARHFVRDVDDIVVAAKEGKDSDKWATYLLQTLEEKSDLDMLEEDYMVLHERLRNTQELPPSYEFVQVCLEENVLPSLIHCLRLLRVLEIKHATEIKQAVVQPITEMAAQRVSSLLCLLCTDPSVGEQLKPHLSGLFSLLGAAYPPSAVHLAQVASTVIVALSEFCLTPDLVSFLHNKKMIVHMTEDIKELCGMSQEVSMPAMKASSACLYGEAAEAVGLWEIAIQTIVKLLSCSCRFRNDLIDDFEATGGHEVLQYALERSDGAHEEKIADALDEYESLRKMIDLSAEA